MAKRKPKITGWILEASLDDGRIVTLDDKEIIVGTYLDKPRLEE